MGEQLENAATEFIREHGFDRWEQSLRELGTERQRALSAPHFVYEPHRRLSGGMPALNRDGYLNYARDYSNVVQVESTRSHVVAIRGDRLAAIQLVVVSETADEFYYLGGWRLTPDLDQLEWMGSYEPEQLDEVRAELDRQHSAICGDQS